MKILNQLETKLSQFEWKQENQKASIFGCINIPQINKRINKDLYRLNNIYVFISSKMGGTPDNPTFYYAMCYQKAEVRPYRCRNTFNVEYNKIFVSDKTLQGIVNQLVEKIDLKRYYLPK